MIVFVFFFSWKRMLILQNIYRVDLMIWAISCCRSQQACSVPPSSSILFCWRTKQQYPLWFLCEITRKDYELLPSLDRMMHQSSRPSSNFAVLGLAGTLACPGNGSHVRLFCLYKEASICLKPFPFVQLFLIRPENQKSWFFKKKTRNLNNL